MTVQTCRQRENVTKRIGRQLGIVVRGREGLGLGNLSERDTRPHVRSWAAYSSLEEASASARRPPRRSTEPGDAL